MLDYISILGCVMSLVGLACIWLTAICFRKWRKEEFNIVILNISFVLTLIMLYFLLLNLPELWNQYISMTNKVHCMIMGGFLHYNVLVLFLWMLIIGINQYKMFVKVMDRSPNNIKKYIIVAWGLPLIPTGLVALLEPNTYMPDAERLASNTAICYPTGKSLYYGVILPITIIILINLGLFVYIFCTLRSSLKKFKHRSEKEQIIIQIRVCVLLFFLLGLSWTFGLLSFLDNGVIFSYLFCLTATLQGFVLFLYAVVIRKTTRDYWMLLCCRKRYRHKEYTNLMPMTSINRSQ